MTGHGRWRSRRRDGAAPALDGPVTVTEWDDDLVLLDPAEPGRPRRHAAGDGPTVAGPTGVAAAGEVPAAHAPVAIGRPMPLIACVVAVVVAAALAGTAARFLQYRRGLTEVRQVVATQHPAGVDLIGCPKEDNCIPLQQPDPAIAELVARHFPGATTLASSTLLDASSTTTIRTTLTVQAGGVRLSVTAQCVAGGAAVPAWTSTLPAVGPVTTALVRPGRHSGCSVGVLADVPTGVAVPGPQLTALAREPGLQLG